MRFHLLVFVVTLYAIAYAQDDTLILQSVTIDPDEKIILAPAYLSLDQPYCFAHFRIGWDGVEDRVISVGVNPIEDQGWEFGVDTVDLIGREISIIGRNSNPRAGDRIHIFDLEFLLKGEISQSIRLTGRHRQRLGYCDGEGGVEPVFSPGDIILSDPIPGDANGSGRVDGEDVIFLVNYLKHRGPSPGTISGGDCDGDCLINALDVTYLVNYFKNRIAGPVLGDCR